MIDDDYKKLMKELKIPSTKKLEKYIKGLKKKIAELELLNEQLLESQDPAGKY